jgi:hypothetical protein
MRTTLTLDPDVARELKRLVRDSQRPFKEVVNTTLRKGLARGGAARRRSYSLTPRSLGGVRPGFNLDKALRLADALEDEGIARKLELRK